MNQREGENDRTNYFMINLHERMLPTRRGSNPQPPNHLLEYKELKAVNFFNLKSLFANFTISVQRDKNFL